MMNGFQAMGEARIMAAEGQRQIAVLMGQAIGRMLVRMFDRVVRHLPETKATPW